MPVSGLVITLADDATAAEAALEQIGGCPHLEAEAPVGRRVAAVLDTADRRKDKDVWHWLGSLQGVVHVDVVFVHFDDESAACGPHPDPRERQVSP